MYSQDASINAITCKPLCHVMFAPSRTFPLLRPTMSSTTQILFNSPALHSLKRDQLVKLCKIHSIKANGKNVELIEKLKQHAAHLPPDALLDSEEEEEEDKENQGPRKAASRPSEGWEVLMESIAEGEESSNQGSLRTLGSQRSVPSEFGTQKCMPSF